ncbi:MAG: helix-turn-helix domain-containing protein [Bacteroidales bacterium]|nr:helix-turn-helix domain-containing protein [Bacteroidales bacterium]
MENTFAIRLLSARKMAGMSLQKLADALGNIVTKQSLNKYEKGVMKPDSDLLVKLSNVLNVPVDYFYAEPIVTVELTNPDYRKHSSRISTTQKAAIEEKTKTLLERYLELENLLNLEDKPSYFEYEDEIITPNDAEKAAKKLREDWDLGYDPIPDVVAMLEDKGYKVIEIDAPGKFDGLSVEVGGLKVIVLNSNLWEGNNCRKRFTALHELAHHSFRFPNGMEKKAEEKLCHVFASAVLYPSAMAEKELHFERFHFYENELILIKERWGISLAAIFQTALRLEIINDYVFKCLNINYRSRGYHKDNNEPGNFLSQEKPVRFLRLVYFALGKGLISVNEAAYYTGNSVWEFRKSMKQMA